MSFEYPEAALLLVPAALAWRALGGGVLRALVLACLVAAATAPALDSWRGGSDVVLVLDRSSSMGEAGRARQDELVRLAAGQRRAGDRLAVVLAGDGAAVASPPRHDGLPALDAAAVGEGGSALAEGLRAAAELFAPGRSGRVLLHSDGEHTGADPSRAAAALAARGVIVDALLEPRPPLGDAAVLEVELPEHLRLGESFLGAVRLLGDADETRVLRVTRDGREIHRAPVALRPGAPVVVSFADRPSAPGVASYEVTLERAGDRRPENNHAAAALAVGGGEAVLVVSGDGRGGNVARALEGAGMEVALRPERPVRLPELAGVRALVLDGVPAAALGLESMADIAQWVEHLGGGLVFGGGRRSFGGGGYHRSPVEAVLPVSLELREETRRHSVGLAIALDRSGSMAAPAGGGRTKMQLAAEGAASAVEMLGPADFAAVWAVDTEAHEILPFAPVSDPRGLGRRVRGIASDGGGIYVYVALATAGKALLRAGVGVRHLVLFADAADAEAPGAWQPLLADYRAVGITVSVIGLGSPGDPDAALLQAIAAAGGGRCHFADSAADLPRLFAHETLLVTRQSWIEGPVTLRPAPALPTVLGSDEALSPWPTVAGYNLNYPRPGAAVLADAPGDPAAPAAAAWQIGTGRAAAVALALDGSDDPGLPAWPGYAPFIAGLVRHVAADRDTAPGALYAERAGREVTLRLELDPARRALWPAAPPALRLPRVGAIEAPPSVPMTPTGDGRYEARITLDDSATLLPAVALGGLAIPGPALRLPYAPEAEPRFDLPPGREVLAEVVRVGGGELRESAEGLFENPPSPGRRAPLGPVLLAAALILLVGEVGWRRLELRGWERPRRAESRGEVVPVRVEVEAAEVVERTEGGESRGVSEALARVRRR